MKVVRAWWSAVAIWVVLLCAAAPARADDPLAKPASAEAHEHLTRGNKLYAVRSFDEAVAEYKAGALIEPAPVFDYNLGQCYRQLGKYQDAIWHYERFLKRAQPQGELLDAVNGFVIQMHSELDKKAMTQQPTEPGPSPPRIPPPPAIAKVSSPEPWYADGFGWGLTAAGLAGVAVAGYLFVDASNLSSDANSNPNQNERTQLRDSASTRNLLGVVIGIGGAGLLITGVIKLAISPKAQSPSTSALNVGLTSNGIMVFGRFP